MGRIPKIIHYCWFGGGPLGRDAQEYMRSWQANCPDYTVMRWDESNFDLSLSDYAREAYEAKKWAFLADYVRLWALEKYGGIYMDTDVELLRPLDEFLDEPAFCGFEHEKQLSTALIGSEPGGAWVRMLLADYEGRHFRRPDGSLDETTNVEAITGRTRGLGGIEINGAFQRAEGLLTVYPRDWFSPMTFYTGKLAVTADTRAVHHFVASWHDETAQRERAVRYRCIRLLGERWGTKAANAVNLARRHDGSLGRAVKYYLSRPFRSGRG